MIEIVSCQFILSKIFLNLKRTSVDINQCRSHWGEKIWSNGKLLLNGLFEVWSLVLTAVNAYLQWFIYLWNISVLKPASWSEFRSWENLPIFWRFLTSSFWSCNIYFNKYSDFHASFLVASSWKTLFISQHLNKNNLHGANSSKLGCEETNKK